MNASFTLARQTGVQALYTSTEVVPGGGSQSTLFYFAYLAPSVQAPPTIGQLGACFDLSGPVGRGAFVFVDGTPPDTDALFTELNASLLFTPNPVSYPRLAWRQNPAVGFPATYLSVLQADNFGVPTTSKLAFGRWVVQVDPPTTFLQVSGDGDHVTLQLAQTSSLSVIVLEQGNPTQSGSFPVSIDIPLTGAHTGAMAFEWTWQQSKLQDQFFGELRLFHGTSPSAATAVRYPLFAPATQSRRPIPDMAFSVTAHPLSPLDGSRTRLALSANPPDPSYNKLNAVMMRTPMGSQVTLTPLSSGNTTDGAGFGFATTVIAGGVDLYMTPVGNFRVDAVSQKSNAPGVLVMAGVSGSEFVLTEVGDILNFANNQPAFVAGTYPNPPPNQPPPQLTADFTTSWASVQKSGSNGGSGDGKITTSYCAQPSNATYFGRHAGQQADDFPVAVGISLAHFTSDPSPLFPFLPYGGVFTFGTANPNLTTAASTVGGLETQVIEPTRRAQIEPKFDWVYGPIFFDATNGVPFAGGSARTPMGFIANLNDGTQLPTPAGSWNTLLLALSPQGANQYLQLTPNSNGVVNPRFSNSALRDNLFMVVTDPDLLWPAPVSGNEIQLGDFTFQVNVGPRGDDDKNQPRALAVFKFMPGVSFVALVNDTARWTAFYGGQDNGPKVQAQIQEYLTAASTGGELYDAFNGIVNDPNWAGLLFFNCPLDYKALPPDIQILLGGIDGTLRAHHFGVTINRIEDVAGAMSISSSSLFAVIDYQKALADILPPAAYPDFHVLLLNVEYANSKLVVFRSTIAFSINTLFGNAVDLTVAPENDNKETGTIVIDGVYTLHEDGTGSLVFATQDERVFTPDGDKVRVLTAQSIDNAALVATTSTPNSDGTVTAVSAFRLDGTLVFADDLAGDLFSYGTPGEDPENDAPESGLVVLDYAFVMTTTIPATEGPATLAPIATDLTGLKVDQARSVARDDSFKATFPSNVESLSFASNAAVTAMFAVTGTWPVLSEDLGLAKLASGPNYLLGFKIPMGNLGGLVSSTNNLVSDLYVGWNAGGSGNDDTFAAILALPASVSGADGFHLQGIVASHFESVQLDQLVFTDKDKTVSLYDLRFQHFSATILGIPLFYQSYGTPLTIGPKDLGMFGDPADPAGNNTLWVVGDSTDTTWAGPTVDINLLEGLPSVFIGRAYKIDTDPTDPNVIESAIDALNIFAQKTVAALIEMITAQYDSSAGMTFALQFTFKAVTLAVLLHDNDFYGAKIVLDFSDDEEEEKEGGDGQDDGEKAESTHPRIGNGNGTARNVAALVGAGSDADDYKLLGLDPSATYKEVYKAYRRQALRLHPDKNIDDPGAKEKFQDLLNAFQRIQKKQTQAAEQQGKKKPDDSDPEVGDQKMIEQDKENDEKDKEKKGLNKLQGFEFSILYRKISEHLGVWAATIFVDVGEIELGAASLTLPDFTISIWTNGDWRFSVGWPLDNHPITVQFQAGPIPVIAKLGFYLAKLRSDDYPAVFQMEPVDKYPPNFNLIWSFGLGISAGVGKEWEKGPFSASASLTLGLVVQGFLASCSGSITNDGVDYYWWCINLNLVGQVEGSVDFKIISASLSITLTFSTTLALETRHATALVITVSVEVEASIKVVFITIHFSFSTTLTILETSFGSGPVASLDGPTPALAPPPTAAVAASSAAQFMRAAFVSLAAVAAAQGTPIAVNFLLQSTATTADGTTWVPQGIATLVLEAGDIHSPFGQLSAGIATWLVNTFATAGAPLQSQLSQVETALGNGAFDAQVDACLSQFAFTVNTFTGTPAPDTRGAVLPVHPSLGVQYQGNTIPFGNSTVPANYGDLVQSYFFQTGGVQPGANGADSVASLVFSEYFVMLAKQLVTELQQSTTTNIPDALTADVIQNVAGFVTRFLMSGLRLPKPSDLSTLAPLYVLTGQQFPLATGVLTANLVAPGQLPAYLSLNGSVSATLTAAQVYNPSSPLARTGWTVGAINPLSPVPKQFPMNASLAWTDLAGATQTVFNFPDALHLAVADWLAENPGSAAPLLSLEQTTGNAAQSVAATPFTACAAMVLPLSIKAIPKPDGVAGQFLENIFSLVGTDEVHRAYLQALLDDGSVQLDSLELAISGGTQGTYVSTKMPAVLVRANLSTSTVPTGFNAAVSSVRAAGNPQAGDGDCSNYAKPAAEGPELAKFLRLVWECSVVHTGGFYIQIDDATLDPNKNPDLYTNGVASLQLIVQTGAAAASFSVGIYHNALIGQPPAKGSAVLSTLEDPSGNPVVEYTASYPGGNTGWAINWANPPLQSDATGAAANALLALYSMVSYRVTAVNGTANVTNWSRPVTALNNTASGQTAWNYQKAFPTAPLLGQSQNTYAAVGSTVTVDISIEDIFGNSLPPASQPLNVVYNDDLLGLANWVGTQTSYQIFPSQQAGVPQLNVNFSYGSLLFSSGNFLDIPTLAKDLSTQADPVSKFIWSRFTPEAQAILNDSKSTAAQVQVAVIQGINTLLGSGVIYDQTVFAGVKLRAQTTDLLAQNPTGNLLIFLNSLLLLDAYPTLLGLEAVDSTNIVQQKRVLADYLRVSNQLRDPNLTAEIATGGLLAAAGALTANVLTGLQGYVDSVVTWLQWWVDPTLPVADVPAPVTLSFNLVQNYPLQWSGDLRELRLSLLLQRSKVLPEVAALAPQVQAVASPIPPLQSSPSAADPSGLIAFALNFETAYYQFDGQPDGVIKVATGVNSDLSSTLLGAQSLWLARWGKTAGISVEILNSTANPPIYYAPPPLSTQLLTRTVSDVLDYTDLNNPKTIPEMAFASVDMDILASQFLSTVENIFSPEFGPTVAVNSQPSDSVYDDYVGAKTDLAQGIANQLVYIYQNIAPDTSDPASAIETLRQALLQTLENDYGIAALVQMAAQITLHGNIEPGGKSPPNLFGNIRTVGDSTPSGNAADPNSPLPYNFSAPKLPLKDGKAWLNFLFSVQNPAAQKAMTLDLDYQMGFIEHDIDPDETRCNYTPSNWLTFVLQQNPATLPQGEQNTLTAPLGTARIPIPLRSYPPLPKLLLATFALSNSQPATIADCLSWTYGLNLDRTVAAQDTLTLMVTFNEPPTAPEAPANAAPTATLERTGDLFDFLARYSYEYPQLAPYIQALPTDTNPADNPTTAVKYFRDLATAVAGAWPGWVAPSSITPSPQPQGSAQEVWTYTIEWETDGSLTFTSSWTRSSGAPPWPQVDGFAFPPTQDPNDPTKTKWIYTPIDPTKIPQLWSMAWSNLYVLDYQSARASAFTERNRNLGGDTTEQTNEAFVYRTDTVSMAAPTVPLLKAPPTILLDPSTSLQAAVTAMFTAMHTMPAGSVGTGDADDLKVGGPISYSFQLLNNTDSVQSYLPLFLLETTIPPNGDAAYAGTVATNLFNWQQATDPAINNSFTSFRLTVFATKIVEGDGQLPLVQFPDLSIPVPAANPAWWQPTS